jgi:uncharacterized membrane protein YedE/YeeE
MFYFVALISGIFFALGLSISGMVNPEKVIGFLDISSEWDPSLAFVMGGALFVFMPSYFFLIKPMKSPLCASSFNLPTTSVYDNRLIVGAGLFCIGWGGLGICPGPAITSIGVGNQGILWFVLAMLAGMKFSSLAKSMIKNKTIVFCYVVC